MSEGATPTCSSCRAPLAADQRYCLNCGTAVGSALGSIRLALTPTTPAEPGPAPSGWRRWWPGLSRGGAILSVCLGLGILFGALVSPNLQTLAAPLIALAGPAPNTVAPGSGAAASAGLGAPAAAPSDSSGGGGGGSGSNTANTGGNTGGNTGNTGSNTGNSGTSTSNTGTTGGTGGNTGNTVGTPGPSQPVKLPPIKHVWLIMLTGQSYNSLFGKTSTAHYLKTTLVPQGTLLSNYYATSHGALADGIALLSGQGPTPEQQQGCPAFTNVTPGTIDSSGAGQVHGHGCVLPPAMFTLPDQLTGNGLSWKAYIAGQHNAAGPLAPAAVCRHPTIGAPDTTAALTASTDGYLTRRNPFVYFHSIIDAPATCTKIDVGLDQLAADLHAGKVPSLSWIAPDPCAAGAPGGCVPPPVTSTPSTTTTATSSPTTPTSSATTTTTSATSSQTSSGSDSSTSSSSSSTSSSSSASTDSSSTTQTSIGVPKAGDTPDPNPVDAFLQEWIPRIQATSAYKKDGMIVILSDQAPEAGPNADSTACCGKLAYVNTTNPGGAGKPGPGGGRTGALVLSTYAGRGATDATPVDHFTLLRTLDDIFNVPYLGYALQRKDFDSVVFPSETGGSGAVSTRVHRNVAVITRTLTTVSTAASPHPPRGTRRTRSASSYAPLSSRPPSRLADDSAPTPLAPVPSFASGG